MNAVTQSLIDILRSAKRKMLLRSKPVFKPHANFSLDALATLEKRIDTSLPVDFRDWLLAMGFGDVDETLSFREEWFTTVETGQLKGSTLFAQDILGNFYAFDATGCVYFLSRSEPGYALMSPDFSDFLQGLIQRDYKLLAWVDSLDVQKYDW
jgi:hypothetical protein